MTMGEERKDGEFHPRFDHSNTNKTHFWHARKFRNSTSVLKGDMLEDSSSGYFAGSFMGRKFKNQRATKDFEKSLEYLLEDLTSTSDNSNNNNGKALSIASAGSVNSLDTVLDRDSMESPGSSSRDGFMIDVTVSDRRHKYKRPNSDIYDFILGSTVSADNSRKHKTRSLCDFSYKPKINKQRSVTSAKEAKIYEKEFENMLDELHSTIKDLDAFSKETIGQSLDSLTTSVESLSSLTTSEQVSTMSERDSSTAVSSSPVSEASFSENNHYNYQPLQNYDSQFESLASTPVSKTSSKQPSDYKYKNNNFCADNFDMDSEARLWSSNSENSAHISNGRNLANERNTTKTTNYRTDKLGIADCSQSLLERKSNSLQSATSKSQKHAAENVNVIEKNRQLQYHHHPEIVAKLVDISRYTIGAENKNQQQLLIANDPQTEEKSTKSKVFDSHDNSVMTMSSEACKVQPICADWKQSEHRNVANGYMKADIQDLASKSKKIGDTNVSKIGGNKTQSHDSLYKKSKHNTSDQLFMGENNNKNGSKHKQGLNSDQLVSDIHMEDQLYYSNNINHHMKEMDICSNGSNSYFKMDQDNRNTRTSESNSIVYKDTSSQNGLPSKIDSDIKQSIKGTSNNSNVLLNDNLVDKPYKESVMYPERSTNGSERGKHYNQNTPKGYGLNSGNGTHGTKGIFATNGNVKRNGLEYMSSSYNELNKRSGNGVMSSSGYSDANIDCDDSVMTSSVLTEDGSMMSSVTDLSGIASEIGYIADNDEISYTAEEGTAIPWMDSKTSEEKGVGDCFIQQGFRPLRFVGAESRYMINPKRGNAITTPTPLKLRKEISTQTSPVIKAASYKAADEVEQDGDYKKQVGNVNDNTKSRSKHLFSVTTAGTQTENSISVDHSNFPEVGYNLCRSCSTSAISQRAAQQSSLLQESKQKHSSMLLQVGFSGGGSGDCSFESSYGFGDYYYNNNSYPPNRRRVSYSSSLTISPLLNGSMSLSGMNAPLERAKSVDSISLFGNGSRRHRSNSDHYVSDIGSIAETCDNSHISHLDKGNNNAGNLSGNPCTNTNNKICDEFDSTPEQKGYKETVKQPDIIVTVHSNDDDISATPAMKADINSQVTSFPNHVDGNPIPMHHLTASYSQPNTHRSSDNLSNIRHRNSSTLNERCQKILREHSRNNQCQQEINTINRKTRCESLPNIYYYCHENEENNIKLRKFASTLIISNVNSYLHSSQMVKRRTLHTQDVNVFEPAKPRQRHDRVRHQSADVVENNRKNRDIEVRKLEIRNRSIDQGKYYPPVVRRRKYSSPSFGMPSAAFDKQKLKPFTPKRIMTYSF